MFLTLHHTHNEVNQILTISRSGLFGQHRAPGVLGRRRRSGSPRLSIREGGGAVGGEGGVIGRRPVRSLRFISALGRRHRRR